MLTLLAVLLFGIGTSCKGQEVVNRMLGTDFWMMFLGQAEGLSGPFYAVDCSLLLTAAEESEVTISYSATGWNTVVTVPAGGATRVQVPESRVVPTHFGAKIDSNAWHIQATTPISVTAYNHTNYSCDATAILPVDALRTYHIAQVYQSDFNGAVMGFVAPYDSTRVWLVLEHDICSLFGPEYYAGDTVELLLNRGQTCLFRNTGGFNRNCSLDGMRVYSDKPVAVFQGHNGAFVPTFPAFSGLSGFQAADCLYDQCIPVEYWGTHFAIEPVIGRQPYVADDSVSFYNYGDLVRVTAKDDNCQIRIDGQDVATLQSGQVYSFILSDHPATLPDSLGIDFYQSPCMELGSTSPVMVCYYITGIHFGGSPGDPAVMTMPPIENGVSHAIFRPRNTTMVSQHWINIVTPTICASQITLDGVNISDRFSNTVGGYSYACIPVTEATHTLDAGNGIFIAYLYGLGEAESYLHTIASNTESNPYNVWNNYNEACVGDSITFNILMFERGLSASWYIDGNWIGDGLDSLTVAFDNAGNHQIITVINPIGDTVFTDITINKYIVTHSTDTICSGQPYTWRGRELTASGLYADTLTVLHGCDSVMTLELSHLVTPQISLVIDEDCNSKEYTVLSTVVPGDSVMPYWRSIPADSTLAGQQWDSIVVSPTIATCYILAFEGQCPNDTTIVLTPSEWPTAVMEVSPSVLSIDNLQFVVQDVSLNATGRTWYVDDEIAGHQPTLYYSAPATSDSVWLMLEATRSGCADTAYVTIPISHSVIWAPNVFTPERDNNQLFIIKGNDVTMIDLYIYARNGVLVWHSDNPSEGWDGTLNGSGPCPQAAYTWILRYTKKDQPKMVYKAVGTVTLLR